MIKENDTNDDDDNNYKDFFNLFERFLYEKYYQTSLKGYDLRLESIDAFIPKPV